jgi:hypothetical protein
LLKNRGALNSGEDWAEYIEGVRRWVPRFTPVADQADA